MRRKVLDMNLTSGIIEVDLHGLRVEEAVKRAKSEVNKASGSVYIIRLIHGYHGGTRIREAIEDEFSYSDHKEGPLGRIPYDALAASVFKRNTKYFLHMDVRKRSRRSGKALIQG